MRRVEIFDGHYVVTDRGDVIRVKTGRGARVGRHLKIALGSKGYPCVCLTVNGKEVVRTVHSLVANAFLGPCPPGNVITFTDSDRTNSTLSNLYYVPKQGNPGEKNGSAKLTEVKVRAILKSRQNGTSGVALARRYGVTASTISLIVKGKIWGWVQRS
jgi:hypothetical protein